MKQLFIFFILIISSNSYGQGVEVVSSVCTSSNLLFQSAKGIGVNYEFLQFDSVLGKKSILFGAGAQYSVNSKNYDQIADVFPSGVKFYTPQQVTSKVQKSSFYFHVLIALINNKNVILAIGPEINYNLLRGRGTEQNFSTNANGAIILNPTSNAFEMQAVNAIGYGLLAKVEVRNIFIPKLALVFNIRPEIMHSHYQLPLSDSGDDGPKLFGVNRFLEFQIGLKYSFNYKRK